MTFARDTGIAVIAQGVETAQQSALLSHTDCAAQAQGFHFSKAVDPVRATELLRQGVAAKSRAPRELHEKQSQVSCGG
jgi:EAL domain-containing protein (putative c-di-GMP-specific phosphodiesterase class I)